MMVVVCFFVGGGVVSFFFLIWIFPWISEENGNSKGLGLLFVRNKIFFFFNLKNLQGMEKWLHLFKSCK